MAFVRCNRWTICFIASDGMPRLLAGTFALGYRDRIAHQERVVPFTLVRLDPERPGMFSYEDDDGMMRHIPLQRSARSTRSEP